MSVALDIERLLKDTHLEYVTEKEHHHCVEGWVNIHCPFCGSQNFHLGISKESGGCHCWRCGTHSIINVLGKALNLSDREVKRLLKTYFSRKTTYKKPVQEQEPKVSIYPLKFPPYTELNKFGRDYLRKRKFSPKKLAREWGLLQTRPMSFLDGISFNNRILIPIYWNGRAVSFQARDITGKSKLKYITCPKKREEIHHKDILYGKQESWPFLNGIIITEGVTDVWRLGECGAATFGISFKTKQVLQLAKHNSRFFILFDNEPQAQEQARKLAVKLKALGKEAHVKDIKMDPGDMREEDVKHLIKELKIY